MLTIIDAEVLLDMLKSIQKSESEYLGSLRS